MRPSPIEAARARHSLADVARRAGIDLYRSSGSVMAHCPLPSHGHFDRSPSLRLHLDDGIWHCFGCGQTGDVVEWVCQSEGVRWGEAIRILDSGRALTRAWTSGEVASSVGIFLLAKRLRQLPHAPSIHQARPIIQTSPEHRRLASSMLWRLPGPTTAAARSMSVARPT